MCLVVKGKGGLLGKRDLELRVFNWGWVKRGL